MRVNEIRELHVTDLRAVDSIQCFTVSEGPLVCCTDKQSKIRTGKRTISVRPSRLVMVLFGRR